MVAFSFRKGQEHKTPLVLGKYLPSKGEAPVAIKKVHEGRVVLHAGETVDI
jgi:hypothetical protein